MSDEAVVWEMQGLRVMADGKAMYYSDTDGWVEEYEHGTIVLAKALAEAKREVRHLGNICKRVEDALGAGAGAAWARISTLKEEVSMWKEHATRLSEEVMDLRKKSRETPGDET